MRYLNSKISALAIFYSASALLVVYLLSIRWHVHVPVVFFWIAISLMVGTILYQILSIKSDSSYTKIVLSEIAITCLLVHMIYLIPYYGLRGSDVYQDMAAVKGILSSGFVMGDPRYVLGVAYFPMIHILGAELSMVTDIGLFSVVKWLPPFLDVALILLLYLLVRHVFQQERIALLSTLLFTLLQHHILFSALFVRETIGLVLAMGCIYLYFLARSSAHPVTYGVLSVICLAGTVFAHHLTSFALFIFLLVHFLVTKVAKLSFLRRVYLGGNITGEKITTSFLLLAFVAPFAYWIDIVGGPLYTLAGFINEVFTPSQWGTATYGEVASISATSIQTIRGYIVFYGFCSFHFIFGAILLYWLLSRARNWRLETYSFTLFLFLCGIGGLLQLYVISYGDMPFPDRFLMFGWLFGFAPLVVAVLKGGYKWFRGVGISLLIAFMLFNIYLIEPTAWDAKAEGVAYTTSEEDYALAVSFDFATGGIAAHQNNLMAIYDVHDKKGENAFGSIEISKLSKYDWVIIQKEALRLTYKYYPEPGTEAIAEMGRLEKEGSPDRNRIYESNNLSVYKLRE